MKRAHVLANDPSKLPKDFWSSDHCETLIIERWASERNSEAKWISEHLPTIAHHVWIASSGTLAQAGQSKWIAISKNAILASAYAVNAHLSITAKESWGLTLPLAHVGGLGIVARSHLLGQQVSLPLKSKWDARDLISWQGELLSLVPTQVHDLVALKMTPPKSLRVVVVGGDRLAPELLRQARELGWPLYPSYGLTEFSSQVATALPGDEAEATLLPHVQARTDESGRLFISGPSLFTGVAKVENERIQYQERSESFWGTDDTAEISNERKHKTFGRRDSIVKVRGEKVDLPALETQLQQLNANLVVLALPHERDGVQLWVVTDKSLDLAEINRGLLPHHKIHGIKIIDSLPRNHLGKIKRGELLSWLQKQS